MAKRQVCKVCRTKYDKSNGFYPVCSETCAVAYVDIKIRTDKIDKIRELTKELRRKKNDILRTDLDRQFRLTQLAFNKLRKLEEFKWFHDRGLEPTCISCGEEMGEDFWVCSHFKTARQRPFLKYDKKNTYLQHGMRCNKYLRRDINGTETTHGYIKGLSLRFGKIYAQEVINYCEDGFSDLEYTWQSVEKMRTLFLGEAKYLKEFEHILRQKNLTGNY